MVLLTMTAAIVDALKSSPEEPDKTPNADETRTSNEVASTRQPALSEPEVGKPISHGQIVDLWKRLQAAQAGSSPSLELLLRGAHVYIQPPPPKKEPVCIQ